MVASYYTIYPPSSAVPHSNLNGAEPWTLLELTMVQETMGVSRPTLGIVTGATFGCGYISVGELCRNYQFELEIRFLGYSMWTVSPLH